MVTFGIYVGGWLKGHETWVLESTLLGFGKFDDPNAFVIGVLRVIFGIQELSYEYLIWTGL